MQPIDINPHDMEIIKQILSQYVPEYEVRAFGSRLNWTGKESSDLDLAIITDKPLDSLRMANLNEAFSESELPFKVDVVDWAATKESFQKIIKQNWVRLQKEKPLSVRDAQAGTTKFKQTEIGMIPEEWEVKQLKELIFVKGRIGWKGLKKSEFGDEGIIIINGPEIKNGKVDWNKCQRVPKWRYEESQEISVKQNDIIMTKDGTIGKTALIKNLPESATLASGIFLIRTESTELDQGFLYQYFNSNFFKNLIKSRIEGSVIPHLYQRDIELMSIPIPSIKEQKAIAKILSDLDDKIELNRQMNKTLEAIGQAIFKHWFVDFEFPNENGKPYKSSGGVMIESEMGEIPKGWRVGKLMEILSSLESGSRPRGGVGSYSEGMPSIGAENILGLGKYNYSKTKFVSTDFFNQMKTGIIQSGDVLLYKDGASLGRKSLFIGGFPFDKCCINEHVFILRTNREFCPIYLYFWLDQDWMTGEIRNLNANSAQPGINQTGVSSLKILIPEIEIVNKFNKVIRHMMFRLFKNCLESQSLAKFRDLLLPKLMSGKIRVKNIK